MLVTLYVIPVIYSNVYRQEAKLSLG